MRSHEKTLYIDLYNPKLQSELACKVIDKSKKQINLDCSKQLVHKIRESFNKNIPDQSPYKEYKLRDSLSHSFYGQGVIDIGGGEEYGMYMEADPLTVSSGIAEIKAKFIPNGWTQGMLDLLKTKQEEHTTEDSLAEISGSVDMFNRITNHGFTNLMQDFNGIIGDEQIDIKNPKTNKIKTIVKSNKEFTKNLEL